MPHYNGGLCSVCPLIQAVSAQCPLHLHWRPVLCVPLALVVSAWCVPIYWQFVLSLPSCIESQCVSIHLRSVLGVCSYTCSQCSVCQFTLAVSASSYIGNQCSLVHWWSVFPLALVIIRASLYIDAQCFLLLW